jgi:hypothetical protein
MMWLPAVVAMQVFLDAVKFNHDPTSASADALNIRRNATSILPRRRTRRCFR